MKGAFKYAIVAAFAGLLAVPARSLAQDAVAGEVIAGETGYEVPVEVTNHNAEPVANLTVVVTGRPPGLVNFRVSPPRVARLAPGETAIFRVTFDVDPDAEPREAAEIGFLILAPGAEFDEPEPKLAVAVVAGHSVPDSLVFADGPKVLRLVHSGGPSAEHPNNSPDPICELTTAKDRAGGLIKCGTIDGRGGALERNASISIVGFPEAIVLGEPFEFEVEIMGNETLLEKARCGDYCVRQRNAAPFVRVIPGPWAAEPTQLSGDYIDFGTARFRVTHTPVSSLCESRKPDGDYVPCSAEQAGGTLGIRDKVRWSFEYRAESNLPGDKGPQMITITHSLHTDENGDVLIHADTRDSDIEYIRNDIAKLRGVVHAAYSMAVNLDRTFTSLYYRPVMPGTVLPDISPFAHPPGFEAPGEDVPDELFVVMETRGGGYFMRGSGGGQVTGWRVDATMTQVMRVPRGVDPVSIAQQHHDELAAVPDCIPQGGIGIPEEIWMPTVWDQGPQVTILEVGPFRDTGEIAEAQRQGAFKLGTEKSTNRDDERVWEGWACDN